LDHTALKNPAYWIRTATFAICPVCPGKLGGLKGSQIGSEIPDNLADFSLVSKHLNSVPQVLTSDIQVYFIGGIQFFPIVSM